MKLDSDKLRGAMLEKCYNIKTLSKVSSVSRATINRALNCSGSSFNMQSVGKLSKALNVPPASLLKE